MSREFRGKEELMLERLLSSAPRAVARDSQAFSYLLRRPRAARARGLSRLDDKILTSFCGASTTCAALRLVHVVQNRQVEALRRRDRANLGNDRVISQARSREDPESGAVDATASTASRLAFALHGGRAAGDEGVALRAIPC